MIYDYVIVGAGLFGSIFAYEATKLGKKVIVLDKRNHIGGNCFTFNYDNYHIHKYGPHIFHTSSKFIWDYISQFTSFNNFSLRNKAYYKDKIYSLPINLNTFSQVWDGCNTPEKAKNILKKEKLYVDNPRNFEEYLMSHIGPTLYEMFFKDYTEKFWGREAKSLPVSIAKRLPIRFDFNDRYYHNSHIYEGIPNDGYTKIFENLLKDIEVILEEDFLKNKEYWQSKAKKIVFSGNLDAYYDYKYGELNYRSLTYINKKLDGDYQGTALMTFTEKEIPHSRIIEHHFFNMKSPNTNYISFEYAAEHEKNINEPYYPINDEKNNLIYEMYKALAEKEDNLIVGGRLGNYKYYDMDMTIGNAITAVKKEFAGIYPNFK